LQTTPTMLVDEDTHAGTTSCQIRKVKEIGYSTGMSKGQIHVYLERCTRLLGLARGNYLKTISLRRKGFFVPTFHWLPTNLLFTVASIRKHTHARGAKITKHLQRCLALLKTTINIQSLLQGRASTILLFCNLEFKLEAGVRTYKSMELKFKSKRL
ncbi:hypothetical protein E2562_019755, partial [Oryza meyeriana var. granulata]